MAIKTKAELKAFNDLYIYNNNLQLVEAGNINQLILDMIDSLALEGEDTFVPYSYATQNVNLNDKSIKARYLIAHHDDTAYDGMIQIERYHTGLINETVTGSIIMNNRNYSGDVTVKLPVSSGTLALTEEIPSPIWYLETEALPAHVRLVTARPLNMLNEKIYNLKTCTDDNDAANKEYVDNSTEDIISIGSGMVADSAGQSLILSADTWKEVKFSGVTTGSLYNVAVGSENGRLKSDFTGQGAYQNQNKFLSRISVIFQDANTEFYITVGVDGTPIDYLKTKFGPGATLTNGIIPISFNCTGYREEGSEISLYIKCVTATTISIVSAINTLEVNAIIGKNIN